MTTKVTRLIGLMPLVAIAGLGVVLKAQDGGQLEPAQPPAEAAVAREFAKAAPQLFKEWLIRRPETLKNLAKGERKDCGSQYSNWFEFIECTDQAEPQEYRIDVTKTDSVLTPFVGHIYVPVKMTCNLKRVVTKGMNNGPKPFEKLSPFCLGKTYDECIAGGGRPAGSWVDSSCTKGPGFTFVHMGEEHVTYRWSEGKWEFQEEKPDRPIKPVSNA